MEIFAGMLTKRFINANACRCDAAINVSELGMQLIQSCTELHSITDIATWGKR
jgi:hypothetical protein